jgi:hypothetical protein
MDKNGFGWKKLTENDKKKLHIIVLKQLKGWSVNNR